MSLCMDIHIEICAHTCEMNIEDICSCVHVYIQVGVYITPFAYVHVCTYMYIYVCIYIYIYVWECLYANACDMWMMLACGCINACTYICVFDHTCVNVCVYVYVYMCIRQIDKINVITSHVKLHCSAQELHIYNSIEQQQTITQ